MDDSKVTSAWTAEEIEKMPDQDQEDKDPAAEDEDKAAEDGVVSKDDGEIKKNLPKPPKKWNYQDKQAADIGSSDNGDPNQVYGLGDILWCRQLNSCYYPAVVVNDPHFKFCTKIVKAETGMSTSRDPETGNGKGRQYHVQFIGDNRLQWIADKYCMSYLGITHYENLAIKDVSNINRVYKPKPDKMQGWREAVMLADDLNGRDKAERVRRMEAERLADKGGNTFIKKLEGEHKIHSPEHFLSSSKHKSPILSPKKNGEKDKDGKDQRKSFQYRRQDEMDYKMHRLTGRLSDGKKSKDKNKNETDSSPKSNTSVLPVFNTNASFSKSFKIKKDTKLQPVIQDIDKVEKATVVPVQPDNQEPIVAPDSSPPFDSSAAMEMDPTEELDEMAAVEKEEEKDDSPTAAGRTDVSEYALSRQKIEQSAKIDGFGEGSLVWAKMRGYPYWPSVVSRDPLDGEFVKVADTIYKNSRRIHILFLEYGNQRAWIGSSSIKKYKGFESFVLDKEKASRKSKPDYTPNKRIKAPFDKAVKYAEELRHYSDEERLEQVLLKYGWALVEDIDSGAEGSTPKARKAEKRAQTVVPMNDLMDAESDSVKESAPEPVEKRRSSESRRSSTEAESRIDPGTDDPDIVPPPQPSISKPKKRESSLIAAIAMNGDTSDSDSDGGGAPPPKKNKTAPKKGDSAKTKPSRKLETAKTVVVNSVTPVKPSPAPGSAPKASPLGGSATPSDKDEFPRVGDLVWGRMPGFPFWPAFVTRSPAGVYRKDQANGKAMYHVQFFGWNDESGWVTTALEFDGLDAFKAIAAKKKSDKSYNPAKGPNFRKWEKAAREAEDTMGLTRQERVDQYMVSYANKLIPDETNSKPVKTPEPSSKASKPSPAVRASPAVKASPAAKPSPVPKPSPAASAKAGEAKTPASGRKYSLPRGWISETRSKDGKDCVVYISPDGAEFPSKAAMQRHISRERTGLGVVYIEDDTLPVGWRCQKIESSIFFFSPIGERFDSRRKVADRMRSDNYSKDSINKVLSADKSRRPAPKSVLKQRGEYVTDESSLETEDEDEEDRVKILPKGHKYRFGGPYDRYLDIEKLFDPSNGGLIDMVQLPDIFLDHPTVRVQECDNEMIISDVDTGEFIAKKIIYD